MPRAMRGRSATTRNANSIDNKNVVVAEAALRKMPSRSPQVS